MMEANLLLAMALTYATLRRASFLSPCGIGAIFFLLQIVVLYIFHTGGAGVFAQAVKDDRVFNSLVGSATNIYAAEILNVFLILIFVSAQIAAKNIPVNVVVAARKGIASNFVTKITHSHWFPIYLGIATVFTIAHLAVIDKSLLWENYSYLALSDPDVMRLTGVSRVIFNVGPIVALIIAITLPLWTVKRDPVWISINFLLFTYFLVYNLAANTRRATLIIALVAIGRYAQQSKRKLPILFAIVVCMLLSFMTVLYGRAHGSGIVNIVPNLIGAVGELSSGTGFTLVDNFCVGGLVLSSAFGQATHIYDSSYILLSFSPLTSSFDGFSALLARNQLRINNFIPYSAPAEAWFFGLYGFCIYAAIFGFGTYYVQRRSLRSPLPLQLTLVCVYSLFLVLSTQYPIRNCLRLLYLAVVIAFVGGYFISRSGFRPSKTALKGNAQNPRSIGRVIASRRGYLNGPRFGAKVNRR